MGPGSREPYCQVSMLSLTRCVTLGELLYLSGPHVLQL